MGVDPVQFRIPEKKIWQGFACDGQCFYIGYDTEHWTGYTRAYSLEGEYANEFENPPGGWHPNDITYDNDHDALILTCYQKGALYRNGKSRALIYRVDKSTGKVLHKWDEKLGMHPDWPNVTPWTLWTAAWYKGYLWRGVRHDHAGFRLQKLDEQGEVLEERSWGNLWKPRQLEIIQGSFIKDGTFWCIGNNRREDKGFTSRIFRMPLDRMPNQPLNDSPGLEYWDILEDVNTETQGIAPTPAGDIYYLTAGGPAGWTAVVYRFLGA